MLARRRRREPSTLEAARLDGGSSGHGSGRGEKAAEELVEHEVVVGVAAVGAHLAGDRDGERVPAARQGGERRADVVAGAVGIRGRAPS
jgi:hypothetical protein